ncbi:endonuclease/exonuclease/phosphatase family protein [Aureivirga sp. CE67]|uniref:endonuclease/exonuclease/phosphatase family protein n=1 Tax=Aureivirga sp. CE67 TaxID=1788983 RepID=UPI0018CB3789|nr:endonuclease/exonuclease/phosphatase family protein [Aureivirga sp. CE67]
MKKFHNVFFICTFLVFLNFGYNYIRGFHFTTNEVKQNKEVTILTYNLFFKNKYKQNILNEIISTKPDILLVQELTYQWNNELQKKLSKIYKYKKISQRKGTHGFGVFSKYPITETKYLKNINKLPFCQINKIKVGKEELIVSNIHLASPAKAIENPKDFYDLYEKIYNLREKEWAKINLYLNKNFSNKNILLCGDFNTMKVEPLYNHIRQDWSDLFHEKGEGFSYTFPNSSKIPFPIITLDYIMYKGKIQPIKAEVLKQSSSDHFAVFGTIKI